MSTYAVKVDTKGYIFGVKENTSNALLQKIVIDRQMSDHGKAILEFTIAKTDNPADGDGIIAKDKPVSIYYGYFPTDKVPVFNENDKIIDCYYLFKVRKRIIKNKTDCTLAVEVELRSADMYIDKEKGNSCYTARKLLNDIINTACETTKGKVTVNTGLKQLLSYEGSGTPYTELRHPYLVRHNETMYEFIRRTANKSGEYLYFEGGKLCLGLSSHPIGDWSTSGVIEVKNWNSISTEYTSETLYGDSRNGSGITRDEYSNTIEKDKYDSESDERGVLTPFYYEFVNTITHAETIGALIVGLLATEYKYFGIPGALSTVLGYAKKNNEKYNSNYFPDKIEENRKDQYGSSNNKFTQFATNSEKYSGKVNEILNKGVTSTYYNNIAQMQAAVSRELLVAEATGKHNHIALGKAFRWGNKSWISVGSEIEVALNNQTSTDFKMKEKAIFAPMLAISGTKQEIAVAPVCCKHVLRVRGGDTAKVEDSADPQRMGRVRVKFPWSDTATPWIPNLSLHATKGGGTHFMPQKGDTVMIEYEEGNVEKPYIAGSMFTSDCPPKFGTRKYQGVISNHHGHSIRFLSPDNTLNYLNGAFPAVGFIRGFAPQVMGNAAGKDSPIAKALGGIEFTDEYGLFKLSASSDNREVVIDSPVGSVSINAYTGININAPNGDVVIEGMDVEIRARNAVNINSGADTKKAGVGTLKNLTDALSNSILDSFKMPLLRSLVVQIATLLRFFRAENNIALKSAGDMKIEVGKWKKAKSGTFADGFKGVWKNGMWSKVFNAERYDLTKMFGRGEPSKISFITHNAGEVKSEEFNQNLIDNNNEVDNNMGDLNKKHNKKHNILIFDNNDNLDNESSNNKNINNEEDNKSIKQNNSEKDENEMGEKDDPILKQHELIIQNKNKNDNIISNEIEYY